MSHKVPHASSHQFGSTADPLYQTVGTGLTAAGSSQSDALALTANVNEVTTTASGTGVKLPTAVAGLEVTVINQGANLLLVYPASGAAIGSLPANIPQWIRAGSRLSFVATASGQWYVPGLSDYRVLAMSAVGVNTTNTTGAETLVTVNTPPYFMGANGTVEITTFWSMTNNANSKTLTTKLGAGAYDGAAVASVASYQKQIMIRNVNSVSSNKAFPATSTSFGTSSGTPITGAVDTGAASTITLISQKATGTDTLTLESYRIVVMYQP